MRRKDAQKFKIKIARFFNIYWLRIHSNDGRVVSNFIIQALKNKDVTIYGDGNQTRSFCFVSDLINVIILIMDTGDDFTGPINIGNIYQFTIQELAEKIVMLTNSSS